MSRSSSIPRLVYSMGLAIMLGFIAAMLATQASEKGFIENLFGEVPDRPILDGGGKESHFVLSEAKPSISGLSVSIQLPHHLEEHSRHLTGELAKNAGVVGSVQMLELTIINDSDTTFEVHDTDQLFRCNMRDGGAIQHQPWPDQLENESIKRALIQKQPNAFLPPHTMRSFWLVVPGTFELGKVQSAILTFVGGQVLTLEPIALPLS